MPTVLITGATDGLGRALARRAHDAGWRVLAHGRSAERGRALLAELGEERTRLLQADLASLAEVRALAGAVLEEERLDVLISNAGIGGTLPGDGRRMESADGHELRFAVNYLAGYVLIRRLLPLLRASAPARIVQVASAGQAPIDFDDVMLQRGYDGTRAYCQSKLAQVMLTYDLADELAGTGVTAACLHPGTYMPTKMVTHAGVTPRTPLEAGVEATWQLAADPALARVGGRYFDGTRAARPHPQAEDPAARARLRALSERLVAAAAVSLRRVTRETVRAVCELRLADHQARRVAPAAFTVAEGHYEPGALLRAIHADGRPAGVLLVEVETGVPFLVRFMVDASRQGEGIGRRAVELLAEELRRAGWTTLETSFVPGEGGAEGFWRRCGFEDTGRVRHGEPVFARRL